MMSREKKISILFLLIMPTLIPMFNTPLMANNISIKVITIDRLYKIINTSSLITENITVINGGTLLIVNSNVTFNPMPNRKIEIYVENGGNLSIINSVIRAEDGTRLAIYIEEGGHVTIKNSTLINMGWKDQRNNDDYLYPGAGFTKDLSRRGHGIEVAGIVDAFVNNRLINITSIRFYSNGVKVINNRISGVAHEAIAFFGNNYIIKNNTIENAIRMDREVHGIRLYPGVKNVTIEGNHIYNIPIGITASQIEPWIKAEGIIIKNNYIEGVFIGLNLLARNSLIEGNVVNRSFIQAAFINDCENITIRNNIFTNYTYTIPRMYTDEYWNEIKHLFPNRDWYEFSIMQRGGILISWRARSIRIINNTFSNAPIYGYAIAFDIRYSAKEITILDNKFIHIGDNNYIEKGGYIKEPNLYSVPLSNIGKAAGAAIELESTSDVYIIRNRFIDCINAITTAFPDAIGNYGNLTIENNFIKGIDPVNWPKYYKNGYKPIVGIGIGTYAYHPEENEERYTIYNSKTTTIIRDNIVKNYIFPIVIDNRQPELKTFIISNNTIDTYHKIILAGAPTNQNTLINKIMPNAKILSMNVSKTNPREGEYITISARVEVDNYTFISMLYPEGFDINMYIDNTLIKKIVATNDGVYTISYTWQASKGQHNIRVIADPYDHIIEMNENDNEGNQVISVKPIITTPPQSEETSPPTQTSPIQTTKSPTPTGTVGEEININTYLVPILIIIVLIIILLTYLVRKRGIGNI